MCMFTNNILKDIFKSNLEIYQFYSKCIYSLQT
jgi:hypothetical protein